MLWDPNKDKPDMSKPSLAGLSWLLKNPSQWPKDFNYNWADANHCAMGLCAAQWPDHRKTTGFWPFKKRLENVYDFCKRSLNLSPGETICIFHNHLTREPAEIADVIDRGCYK